jgi:hypothetical protein
MANGNGGARPGAGRPRKAEKYAVPVRKAEKRILDRLPQLVDNLLLLADGVTVAELSGEERIVYSKPPDRQANEYLVNRIMGKPTERQELTGEDGNPIQVIEIVRPGSE